MAMVPAQKVKTKEMRAMGRHIGSPDFAKRTALSPVNENATSMLKNDQFHATTRI